MSSGEPDPIEKLAFAVVGRTLGVHVEHFDTCGRRGAVDALLHYPDGRVAALEVSSLGPQQEAEISGVLNGSGYRRAPKGLRGLWIASVPRDFKPVHLRALEQGILACEELGLVDLSALPGYLSASTQPTRPRRRDRVTARLVEAKPGAKPCIHVTLAPIWAFEGEGIKPLPDELASLLSVERMRSKVAKLDRTGLDERHLFLHARPTAFTAPVFLALAFSEDLPHGPPPLPAGLHRLWLTAEPYARGGVLTATSDGWQRLPPQAPGPRVMSTH